MLGSRGVLSARIWAAWCGAIADAAIVEDEDGIVLRQELDLVSPGEGAAIQAHD